MSSYNSGFTLSNLLNDLRASNVIIKQNPSRCYTSREIDNGVDLYLVVSNCLALTNGLWQIKSPFTGTEILNDLISLFKNYTDTYIGHWLVVSGNNFNFNGSHLKGLAEPQDNSDATTKQFVVNAINTLSTTTTTNTNNILAAAKAYTDIQQARIDDMLSGSSSSLNSFIELVNNYNALDSAEATNLVNTTNSLTTKINTETTRATAAETSLQTSVTTLTTNLTALTTKQANDIATELNRAQTAETTLNNKVAALETQVGWLFTYWFNTDRTSQPIR
jgi:hypothetical protein